MSRTTAVTYYYNSLRCNWTDILVKSKRCGSRKTIL